MTLVKELWGIGWQVRLIMVAVAAFVLYAVIFDPSGARDDSRPKGRTCHASAEACASYYDNLDRPGPGEGGW
jgi:hypothetical protein